MSRQPGFSSPSVVPPGHRFVKSIPIRYKEEPVYNWGDIRNEKPIDVSKLQKEERVTSVDAGSEDHSRTGTLPPPLKRVSDKRQEPTSLRQDVDRIEIERIQEDVNVLRNVVTERLDGQDEILKNLYILVNRVFQQEQEQQSSSQDSQNIGGGLTADGSVDHTIAHCLVGGLESNNQDDKKPCACRTSNIISSNNTTTLIDEANNGCNVHFKKYIRNDIGMESYLAGEKSAFDNSYGNLCRVITHILLEKAEDELIEKEMTFRHAIALGVLIGVRIGHPGPSGRSEVFSFLNEDKSTSRIKEYSNFDYKWAVSNAGKKNKNKLLNFNNYPNTEKTDCTESKSNNVNQPATAGMKPALTVLF